MFHSGPKEELLELLPLKGQIREKVLQILYNQWIKQFNVMVEIIRFI